VFLFNLCFECHFVSLVFPDSVHDYRCYGRLNCRVTGSTAPHKSVAFEIFKLSFFIRRSPLKIAVKDTNKIID
jgi:hypothetical protein